MEQSDTTPELSPSTFSELEEEEVGEKLHQTDSVSSSNNTEELSNNNDETTQEKNEWIDLLGTGRIKKKILREGEPDSKPQRLQKCVLNYTCTLEDDTVVEAEDNFEMHLGDCDVIQGLDVAVGLMNTKEKCILKIEPRLAYSSKGLQPKIPPNATLIYEIELAAVLDEDDPETLTVNQRKLKGNKKKERGNWWYGRGENQLAIQCYKRALDYLDEVENNSVFDDRKIENKEVVSDAELQNLLEDRLSVSNNMAAAQIKLELYDAALTSLQTVLKCQPNNVKALFRKSKILRAKHDLIGALKCLQKADGVSPNNIDVQKEITVVTNILQKQKVTERELARRMFNGPKSNKNKKKPQRNKLYLWATVGVSVAVGFAGMWMYKFKY